MLVALTIFLLKRRISAWRFLVKLFRNVCCIASSMLFSIVAKSQDTKLTYNILTGGKVIGKAVAIKNVQGATTKYQMRTDSKARLVFSLEISTREESVFDNGMLMRSAFLQKNNGAIKVNTHVNWNGLGYQFIKDGDTVICKHKTIMANMMMLYFTHPDPSLKVFTDHFQTFIPVRKLSAEEYKVTLPNGTEKHFFYKNGICHRLHTKSNFFDIVMELVL